MKVRKLVLFVYVTVIAAAGCTSSLRMDAGHPDAGADAPAAPADPSLNVGPDVPVALDLDAPDVPVALDVDAPDLADAAHLAPEARPLDPSCPHPQQLYGHISPYIAAAPFVAAVPPDLVIGIDIGLPMRYPDGSLPDGAMTSEEFTEIYGATPEDYQALLDWAQACGFSVVYTFMDRLLVSVSGTAALIERTFCVNLNYYLRPDGTQFYAPDREPSDNSPVPLNYISNLDDYGAPHGPPGVPEILN